MGYFFKKRVVDQCFQIFCLKTKYYSYDYQLQILNTENNKEKKIEVKTELTASSIVDEDPDVENLTESERNITKVDDAIPDVKQI